MKKFQLLKVTAGLVLVMAGLGCLATSFEPQATAARPAGAQIAATPSRPPAATGSAAPSPTTAPGATSTPPAAALPAGAAEFTVDAGKPLHPFSNEMLGVALVNWEHSWGKAFPGDVPGLAGILKAAHVGLIRYAGGLWANSVGWERLPQRTPATAWTPDPQNYHPLFQDAIDPLEYDFHYGQNEIDSLAKLSRESGAEVLIQMNVSNDDAEMWADMAHYANVENDYGFKYWEIGNELDLECRNEAETCVKADEYESRARDYVNALRAVDPSLVVVGGVPASGHAFFGADDYSGATTAMSPWLYAGRDAGAQALSFHWYTDCYLSKLDNLLTFDWGVPYDAWQHTYSRRWSEIGPARVEAEVIGSTGLAQGITELNVDACDFGRAPVNSNHLGAVWMADIIGRLGYNGLDFMTWYTGYGAAWQGFPALAAESDYYPWGGGPIYLRPSYYTLFLYGNFFGDRYVQSASPDPEKLSIWASTDSDDPGRLKLMVVNLSDGDVTAPIVVGGFTPTGGRRYTLRNPNPLALDEASNGPDHGTTINGLKLTPDNAATAAAQLERDAPAVTVSGNRVTATFPPYSATAIVLESKPQPPTPTPVAVNWAPFVARGR